MTDIKIIDVKDITDAVAKAAVEANLYLPVCLTDRIVEATDAESAPLAKKMFEDMQINIKAADELQVPICQDCGMAVIFADIGRDIHINGNFEDAVNDGVAKGYTEGYLRKSVVADPIRRGNTGNNTPAVIHTRIVEGDKLTLTVAPKGFGSENMSRIKMFNPTASVDSIIDFVVETVVIADARACPPLVIGVGIGGDFEYSAYLSKKALCRDIDIKNADPFYSELEDTMLKRINATGIGAQGYGGEITALACNIEHFPTHIAGLPVAVNVGCHVTRHKTVVL